MPGLQDKNPVSTVLVQDGLAAEANAALGVYVEDFDLDYLAEEIPVAIQHTLKGVGRIAKIVQAMKIFAHPGGEEKEPADINNEIEKSRTNVQVAYSKWKPSFDRTQNSYQRFLDTQGGSLKSLNTRRNQLNDTKTELVSRIKHLKRQVTRLKKAWKDREELLNRLDDERNHLFSRSHYGQLFLSTSYGLLSSLLSFECIDYI